MSFPKNVDMRPEDPRFVLGFPRRSELPREPVTDFDCEPDALDPFDCDGSCKRESGPPASPLDFDWETLFSIENFDFLKLFFFLCGFASTLLWLWPALSARGGVSAGATSPGGFALLCGPRFLRGRKGRFPLSREGLRAFCGGVHNSHFRFQSAVAFRFARRASEVKCESSFGTSSIEVLLLCFFTNFCGFGALGETAFFGFLPRAGLKLSLKLRGTFPSRESRGRDESLFRVDFLRLGRFFFPAFRSESLRFAQSFRCDPPRLLCGVWALGSAKPPGGPGAWPYIAGAWYSACTGYIGL